MFCNMYYCCCCVAEESRFLVEAYTRNYYYYFTKILKGCVWCLRVVIAFSTMNIRMHCTHRQCTVQQHSWVPVFTSGMHRIHSGIWPGFYCIEQKVKYEFPLRIFTQKMCTVAYPVRFYRTPIPENTGSGSWTLSMFYSLFGKVINMTKWSIFSRTSSRIR